MAVHIRLSRMCHHQLLRTCSFIYSAFFRAARFGLAGSPAASVDFLRVALRFNRVFILFRFRDTPNDPLQRLPFFDFLSPLPI